MEKYTEREVKRSIRNLQLSIEDIISTNSATYRTKIGGFVELTKTDTIIKRIVNPFREEDIDLDAIHHSRNGFRVDEIRLPLSVDGRIAYIVQVFEKVVNENFPLDKFAYAIYGHRSLSDNVNEYLHDIAIPRLKELQYKLDDLIEDEVEGKGEVSQASIQLINHGTIKAQHGSNIALGKDIQQRTSYNSGEIANEIIEMVKQEGLISIERIPEVERLANEVQNEIVKDEASQGKLKELAGKVYEIGEQGLLKIFTTVVTDPRWGQVVAETLMNI